VVQLIIKINVN